MPAIQRIIKGKRKVGAIITQDNDVVILVAIKNFADMFRDPKLSLSESIRKGTAGWQLDMELLMRARKANAKYVIIKLRGKANIWVTRFDNFGNTAHSKLVAKGKKVGRVLPLSYFVEANQEFLL